MAWHVLYTEVFSTVSNENIAFVFDIIGVCSDVKGSKLLDVFIGHIDAFHQRVPAYNSSIKRRQQIQCLRELVPRIVVPFWLTDFIEDLLVWSINGNIELCRQGIQFFDNLWKCAVGYKHGCHAVLVAQIHVFREASVKGGLTVQ